jgi:Zn-dependent protease
MKQTLRLGRVAGIPVGLHWSVLVIMVLLAQSLAMVSLPASVPGAAAGTYWVVAAASTVLFLASLLAHELAHALLARHHRMRVERVTLWMLGGVAELGGQPQTPRVDLQVAVVGPLTSLAAAGAFFGAALAGAGLLPRLWVAALVWLALINAMLAVFNLLPAAPLDGGRVLRALLWRHWNDQARAQVAAARAGRFLGMALIGLGIAEILLTGSLGGIWLMLIGWFLTSAAAAESQAALLTTRLAGVPVRAVMNTRPALAGAGDDIQTFLATVAARSRQRWFPVIDGIGRPVGTVALTALARVPAPRRPVTSIGSLTIRAATVEADAPLADVAPLASTSGAPTLVVDRGVLVGVLEAADVTRALDRASLGLPASTGQVRD